MFWVDRIFSDIESRFKERLSSGHTFIVRDEKTASGRVHVGSMRALSLHAVIAERLSEAGVPNVFKYEINDFDPMDGLPVYLDAAVYKEHMGKPLYSIPSPDPKVAPNFAEYFAKDYIEAIHKAGFNPEFYRGSELYLSGKMNGVIKMALLGASAIRKIYKEVSGAERADTWLPISIICENCGKVGTTKAYDFDGEEVSYECFPKAVEWTEGCGHRGKISPFDGRGKLPWKVEWAAKWPVVGVDIEGGGKDHYSKGGARDVAERISKEVFNYEPPFGVPNEFFLVGGKKMSSSKGQGSSAREIVDLVPPHILRLALFGKDINHQINFDPAGDTIPVLFDTYDRLAEKFWREERDDDTRFFLYIHSQEERRDIPKRFLPRFSQVAFIVQMPHLDLEEEITKIKGGTLSDGDKKELNLRSLYAKRWLERAAPEEFRFELQKELPEIAKSLSDIQKEALKDLLEFIEKTNSLDGQTIHTKLHEIRQEKGIESKELFSAIYKIFLGKESGPKAGWFLSVMEREFLIQRLRKSVS